MPALLIDVKGDLPNLLLPFPSFDAAPFLPWVEGVAAARDERPHEVIAQELADERKRGLTSWGIGEAELAAYRESIDVRVITPGSSAGERLHVLSALERHTERWTHEPEAARAALSAAVSLLLRLVGRDPDPARSREHVLLSVLAERRLHAGGGADLPLLLADLAEPPIARRRARARRLHLQEGPRRARREPQHPARLPLTPKTRPPSRPSSPCSNKPAPSVSRIGL